MVCRGEVVTSHAEQVLNDALDREIRVIESY